MDARALPRGEWRRSLGLVRQDTWLFSGTIRDNIAYGREGATEEQIVSAAQAAHADHFIRTLPRGYDAVLNEEATNISQGQAYYHRAPSWLIRPCCWTRRPPALTPARSCSFARQAPR
ncbi:hypothetical protein [Deinococcus hopiensis]|uniref:hypothetical protein n=1 Tax=Deinococcus hopiensis TaxID=309885 RepID=UPI000A0622B0|nr:hypothetical protein [Deinococcus hopiensis]